MSLSAIEVNKLKQAPAADGVLPLFLDRWSPRSFADREVSPADLHKVFEAVRWSASSYNEQPWRFLVGYRSSATYQNIFDALIPFNKAWASHAPVLILGAAKTRFSHNESPNRVALFDLGAASAVLCLQAEALSLSTHQMAGFDEAKARKGLEVPEDYLIGSVIALGYQGEPAALGDPQMLTQELAPRQRKPLKDFVFSSWGVAADLERQL